MRHSPDAVRLRLPVDCFVLWPVNYSQHWVLAVLDRRNRSFLVYDSLRGYGHDQRKGTLEILKFC